MINKTDETHLISEITGEVTIKITQGENSITLNSNAITGEENWLDIEPILHDGKLVAFDSNNVSITATSSMNERQIQFRVYSIKLATHEDQSITHRLYSNDHSRCKNLRGSKRFSLGTNGIVQLGQHRGTRECIVRNISYGGFCLVIRGHAQPVVNEPMNLHFEHTKNHIRVMVNVNAVVVRVNYNEENDETTIGLKLLKDNGQVHQVVNLVQQDELFKLRHSKRN